MNEKQRELFDAMSAISEECFRATTEVWGIAVMAPKQRPAAEKHCFGDCGKLSLGGVINDLRTGGLFVCCEPTCPHEEKTFREYGETMSFGRQHIVHLRILREETHNV